MADVSQSEFEGLTSRKLQIAEDVQYYLDKHNFIGVGVFTHVHHVDGGRVRKVPAPDSDDLDLAMKSIQREGKIYLYLGDHPRVIKCLAKGDFFVDLEYALHRDIESCLRSHHDTSDECRIRLAQGVIEAVVFIHSKSIIHSDLAARQFLLDSELHVKISDFGFSSFSDGDVLGFENSSHQLPRELDSDKPSTVQSDLFALGSTLYEIMTGGRPYEGIPDDTITELYIRGSFPDVTSILCGDVITSCWQGCFRNAEEVLERFLHYIMEM
ncbi:kinase-like protein [Mollisia scopiformis]|uniref:Kinase-like protein n=1 Tax=Mollisia scopiformis TaxID=149040 RepID=A0A194X2N3_MOLSC|nr:kinase-like protein [Mollisia scopiformis]KUJ14097.1 kinase-like protein [Mollisia scopiformis]